MQAITTDLQALEYCKTNTNTRLFLVWPRGYKYKDFIIEELQDLGVIFYIRKIELKPDAVHSFLQYIYQHQSIAERNINEYFPPNFGAPYYLSALFLQTDKRLSIIRKKKEQIRNILGIKFFISSLFVPLFFPTLRSSIYLHTT